MGRSGVQFELVGLPECMQTLQQDKASPSEDVMVFDMRNAAKAKPTRPEAKPAGFINLKSEGHQEVEVLVSDKDRSRLEKRNIAQTRAEFQHYRHMMEKVLGTDEELVARAKRRGGEIVEISSEADPSKFTGERATATAQDNLPADDQDGDSSSYESDQYQDDFHEILEEVVRQQADLEEDRDDNPDLNETDVLEGGPIEESKTRTSSQETADTGSAFVSSRDTGTEELIWQQIIDRHGRDHFELIYSITDKYVSRICPPHTFACLRRDKTGSSRSSSRRSTAKFVLNWARCCLKRACWS